MRQVLITGGGSGIGRGIAQAMADAGDAVTIAGRRMDALQETDGGRGMTCLTCDVTDEASVNALFTQPYDVVIANAGAGKSMKLRDMPLDVFKSTVDVNLTGTFLTFRAALQTMTRGGRLIAIASTAGLQGGPNISAYVSAKHGVIGLVRALATEVARDGITCNAVCPGFVDTPMGQAAAEGVAARFNISLDEATARITSGNPMRRMITVDEVVAAVTFLASEGASMVNGHTLSVSGGEI
ncbi:SDR family oxidoreductase [Sulfitobacter pseudonitzschiae]|uniref:SDR family oxidoreductase n=1 Tax=Pseudosulfitobacter pseudonitzschiae TaxID=1402135 RepID=A0A9Q2RUR9_9RHOB|nr:SDR family NAD(P)-dependent oxidoreductase [Pseudosulfitobacter pseudonitzschiae]MBM2292252.1 SDR family oxidoreductase [Pseudosulfitobacter pseudonitzschiae]MBM2297170.1 SDR family oxidoreductase [Pseudosulfitobacter pseudonitzschiae]MBM2302084.1 SDR family oxidoreductase [Pseudosulfitobacter pseudonitzschiae]MBM2311866.1 SDR family oxidoreductase [Pseudosulfitobacter pseudonitzschiae]MBM2316780.1 SDR family oxidoreductase [Pseudosulfitobacter pseudonitzschiae]|tara:strand:- start:3348 stop:4067 length:720 start_codon:yes stop_codon:yes gene_type:complete